ncbi:hypothetical protein [Vacuolonema iberomarrocanum]|uniref:hypothetical protein n=1 Tax=Vacuolonema iberomarrocanum TaxID=3454632 RepID=UPI0019DDB809|nr:hypothetical protein [filamentous cyanobacterium LEGE 07170]
MFSQTYYLLRTRQDGQYLVATGQSDDTEPDTPPTQFLLLFNDHAEALSYLNTHAAGYADRFSVESQAGPQLLNVLKRWGYKGVGVVKDPLIPTVDFFAVTDS